MTYLIHLLQMLEESIQVSRFEREFNNRFLHMLEQSNKVSPIAARSRSLTSWLKILKLCEHPEIAAKIEVMKTEVMKYQALAASINSFMKGTIAKERTL